MFAEECESQVRIDELRSLDKPADADRRFAGLQSYPVQAETMRSVVRQDDIAKILPGVVQRPDPLVTDVRLERGFV